MIKHLKIFSLIYMALMMAGSATAQSDSDGGIEMADLMYESGKIYVVVAVLSTIFIGIILYMILLEKRIAKLEKELNK